MAVKFNQQELLRSLVAPMIKAELPRFDVGDTVNVHCRIVEGDKERIQIFQGVLIGRTRGGINAMMTVRRIVDDIGIERVFPVNSPLISKIEVVRRADARRAKLYYLRDRQGKSRRLRDRRRGMKHVEGLPLAGQG